MQFSDLFFLYLFLPLCLLVYYVGRNNIYRNIVLLIFSLIFYAWDKPGLVLLIVASAFINYLFGIHIGKNREEKGAKISVALSLILNIGLLVLFKYSGFVIENINTLLSLQIPVPSVSLPIGISFYTFQIISYIMDCYWGKIEPQKEFYKFLLYVSLFPNVVSGPIIRYGNIAEDLDNRIVDITDINNGINRIIIGLAKKVIIADNLGIVVETFLGSNIQALSVAGCWYGIILYALQMYFDFSGYSDIAIGIARLFGFKYAENFNYPFICKSIAEFWQRWHISLSSFFRDYLLYVPIFGKTRKYGGLFLVWFCTGLWHGASWNFIIWGLYFGTFILIESLIGKKRLKKIPVIIQHIYSKTLIAVGFGIFYFQDTGSLISLFKGLVGLNGNNLFDELVLHSIANNIFLIAAAILFSMPIIKTIERLALKKESSSITYGAIQIASNATLLILSSIILVNSTDNPFLYFKVF